MDEKDRQPEQRQRAGLMDGGGRDVHVEQDDQDSERDLGRHRRDQPQ